MLNDPKEAKGGSARGQNPNAGWYNRFVQTGKSDHETKSNGCFGGQVHHLLHHSTISIAYMPHYTCSLLVLTWYVLHCTTANNHIAAVRLWFDYMCMCLMGNTGLFVPVVSSSFTGSLHPTPCIEWMQGKRGDPGCMAKAVAHPLPHVTVFCVYTCPYVHRCPYVSAGMCV